MAPTAMANVCESNVSQMVASNHLSRYCFGLSCNEFQFGAEARKDRDKSKGRSATLTENNRGDRDFEFTTNWVDWILPSTAHCSLDA